LIVAKRPAASRICSALVIPYRAPKKLRDSAPLRQLLFSEVV
jgi:hypothetical protein